jgi:hypothetical protein
MKKSELIAKLEELSGGADVNIYIETAEHLTDSFNIIIDKDMDIIIET